MTSTPNKGYALQVTGTNIGTWGTVQNNSVISTIDNNLGGTLNISVAGNSNINLTASQASYLIHNLTGALTGNINYIFPVAGGLYFINNQTTGAYSVTVTVVGGTGGIVVPQGQSIPLVVDATTPAVDGLNGTQYVFAAESVGGTANAVTIPTTTPSNFTLNTGTILFFTPTQSNTGSATITTPDGSVKTIQKETYGGLANLQPQDLQDGLPIIVQYNGTVWIGLNIVIFTTPYVTEVSTSQSVTFANAFLVYVNTTAVTYTITETTNLLAYWQITINASGGAATITPNASDVINVNGRALSAGASYVIPQGASALITTDANGNLYIIFNSVPLDAIGNTQGDILYRGSSVWSVLAPGTSGQLLQSGGSAANPSWTTVLAAGTTATTQAANDSSPKVATTAFANPSRSIGTNGYQELPSGLFIQWGNASTSGGAVSVSFPRAFPNAAVSVTATVANTAIEAISVNTVSTSGFAAAASGTQGFYWMAIGY